MPSELAVTSVRPSGANADESHEISVTCERRSELPGPVPVGDIPQDRGTVRIAAGKRPPIGRERRRGHLAMVTGQRRSQPPGRPVTRDIPHDHRAIVTAGRQHPPVPGERHGVHRAAVGRPAAVPAAGAGRSVTSHTITVPSSLPVASIRPSRENVTEFTGPPVAGERRSQPPGRGSGP